MTDLPFDPESNELEDLGRHYIFRIYFEGGGFFSPNSRAGVHGRICEVMGINKFPTKKITDNLHDSIALPYTDYLDLNKYNKFAIRGTIPIDVVIIDYGAKLIEKLKSELRKGKLDRLR